MTPVAVTGPRRAPARPFVLAAVAVGCFGLTGCGLDAPSLDVPPQSGVTGGPAPAPATGVPSTYTGLGSRLAAFARAHPEAPLATAAKAGKGEVSSSVRANAAGRVTGYLATFNYQPPISDTQRLASAIGLGDLPADRITIKSGPTCIVYASPTLKRLIGLLYTRVATTPGSSTADVRATPTPAC